jgi:hypothetical protein
VKIWRLAYEYLTGNIAHWRPQSRWYHRLSGLVSVRYSYILNGISAAI